MRALLRRAEHTGVVVIPQRVGPPVRFPKSALPEAFLHEMNRMHGEDGDLHPLHVAIANSINPELYAGTFLASSHQVVDQDGETIPGGIEDVSE